MSTTEYMVRHAEERISKAMKDWGLVAIMGAYGCGKTTLAKKIAEERGMKFVSLETPRVYRQARDDPVAFISSFLPHGGVIDEFQKAPQLASAFRLYTDANETPVPFIVTGSVSRFSSSPVNRMEACIVHLGTFSQGEIEGVGLESDFLGSAFRGERPHFKSAASSGDVWSRILRGGYPGAVLAESSIQWLKNYGDLIESQCVKAHYRVRETEKFNEFILYLAEVCGSVVDKPAWAKKLNVTLQTIERWLRILMSTYIVDLSSSWFYHRIPDLIKEPPRLYFNDSGLLASLRGWTHFPSTFPHHHRQLLLKNFVYGQLQRSAGYLDAFSCYARGYKHSSGAKVDFVIEMDQALVAVDVKASPSVESVDFEGLRHLKKLSLQHKMKFASGVIFYTGDKIQRFDGPFYAVPVERLWGQRSSKKRSTKEKA